MTDHIPFRSIEKKWQSRWDSDGLFMAPDAPSGKKCYVLVMFPYPSGRAHMGHLRNYTIGDVIARVRLMQGCDVLQPIGWDAFGLPAENAAIKNKIDPEIWTRQNIVAMKEQFKSWGIGYDWSREIATCDPEYYRWNQWIFLQLFKKGQAYKKKSSVNFCPSCQTVLANEQVTHQLTCWRCDTPVKEKDLEQWFFRITDYAQELLDSHGELKEGWPAEVLTMQKHWIGRSEGAEIDFGIAGREIPPLKVFTTRPDTLFGATFMVLAPEHPQVLELTEPARRTEVSKFIEKARRLSLAQRTDFATKGGVFTGTHAVNPVNGEKMPIWISDYVLMEYGTGAIMAVPAHDQRDLDFATTHHIPIRTVILPTAGQKNPDPGKAFEEAGVLTASAEFDGMGSPKAGSAIVQKLEGQGKAKAVIRYRLKDWLLSRQRAWGAPIPVIHCRDCGYQPVPESDLPVILPKGTRYTGKGESPLAANETFVNVKCPKCRGPAKRETDTMDTFVDSSWYYARYLDPENSSEPFDREKAKAWLPVDQYVGGIEHACMHLIYSRYFHKVLRDLGLASGNEPFKRLLTQGMVTLGGSAMSKSKGNIVDPQEIIAKFGADTARVFILFAAPPEKSLEWSEEGVEGAYRFLNRVWRLRKMIWDNEGSPARTSAQQQEEARKNLLHALHAAVHKIRQSIDHYGYNTAIAALMELTNALYAHPCPGDDVSREAYERLVQLLAPFAPHTAEELWDAIGRRTSVFKSGWPEPDPKYLVLDVIELAVQINGKVRDRLELSADAQEGEAREKALALPRVRELVKDKNVVKVIFVPRRLVNIVLK